MPTKKAESSDPSPKATDPQPSRDDNASSESDPATSYAFEDAEITENRSSKQDDEFTKFADEAIKALIAAGKVGTANGFRFNTKPGDKQSTIRHKLNVVASRNNVRVRCVVTTNEDGTFRFGVKAAPLKEKAESASPKSE